MGAARGYARGCRHKRWLEWLASVKRKQSLAAKATSTRPAGKKALARTQPGNWQGGGSSQGSRRSNQTNTTVRSIVVIVTN